MYKRMWIFVEGKNDREFANVVLLPVLRRKYDFIDTWQYAGEPPKKVADFLRGMRSAGADGLFLADLDDSPCVTAKKGVLLERFRKALEPSDVVVVVKEIESWYLAGADEDVCRGLGITSSLRTDNVTKEQFRGMIPDRFKGSVADFMAEILRGFSVETARAKNLSFRYLVDKLEGRSEED